MTQRRLIASITVSLNGLINDATDPATAGMGWLHEHATAEVTRAHFEGIWRGADTIVLGRKNYEGFLGYWRPLATDDTAHPRDRALATWLTDTPKIVASTTIDDPTWEQTTITTDPITDIRALKQQPGGDIIVLNSASLIRQLLRLDLVDALNLHQAPTILGAGDRLLDEVPTSRWALDSVTTIPTGALALLYSRR